MNKLSFKAKLKKQIWESPNYRRGSLKNIRKDFFGNPALVKILKYSKEANFILDCGCGDGRIINLVWRKEARFWGIDISSRFIKLGNKRLKNKKNIILQVGDIERLSFPDQMFDLVYTAFTLEHLDQPEKAILEMIKVAKKGGYLLFICPNYGSPFFPSPCSPTSGQSLILRGAKIFLKSHLYLFKKPYGLDWLKVYPKALEGKELQLDWDAVVEPYLQTLLIFLKENQVEIIESSSTLQAVADRVEPKLGKGTAFRKFALFLEKKNISPYQYYGPSLFVIGKKQ